MSRKDKNMYRRRDAPNESILEIDLANKNLNHRPTICSYLVNSSLRKRIPLGIFRNVITDHIPNLFKIMIKWLIGWHMLPIYYIPDNCICCISPHIDNHDFVRPFYNVSFLSECNIVLGSNMKIVRLGEFIESISIPLLVGIYIAFRKMEKTKWPHWFKLEIDLQNVKHYDLSDEIESQQENTERNAYVDIRTIIRKLSEKLDRAKNKSLHFDKAQKLME
ncbi:hypothetical protein IEQ34_015171 [Dendrobium chrysotoxum]|uniref:Uncharacterized protein n=1 Tax=Dendrobium chrysotoxum TaxID=161865 RepID=A0AAV7GP57_DENCH|nr:hypothetical protein IEQ34_015171 [Dendrobium chrysotoxum]